MRRNLQPDCLIFAAGSAPQGIRVPWRALVSGKDGTPNRSSSAKIGDVKFVQMGTGIT
jgi:hypothetical protein